MKAIIQEKLRALEREFDIRILFACESGSRAWGFASADSDFDVRFIYVHKADFYLSLNDQRDVVELPVNEVLDISGWELRKALRLFRKSNAPLYEWLQSPVVYEADPGFVGEMRALMPRYFSPRAAMHHYLSMTLGIFESDLSGDTVRLKKYCYALRTLLACQWIVNHSEVPPMEFDKLRAIMRADLNETVDDLLRQKAVGDEKSSIASLASVNDYIREQMAICKRAVSETGVAVDDEPLNRIFRKYIV
ncbi:DNA polymerase beta superfamily protein [Chryseolinea soli]|uniref:Nucleotidyltransferase domain-containing protein n=1 Tax=Chryseolinea soli TaxID=2321403 RepID=A0A385SN40_9BACT|nr:nucleotidyltransferase domain-containing protein [Chryseolinea soli]AYB30408.1 nucleotidyltransferase domain-containing protein [Chryseolinea soli]